MIRRGMIAGGAVVAALVVVYIVPRVMDWDRYRGQITALAAARLGRPVTIGGDVGLTILPQPVLTAKGISVTDPVTGAVFTAREMQLRVGLLGLLTGKIDPQALDLEDAVVRLPWPVPPEGFKLRPPQSFAASIENGTLVVGGVTISQIDGELATFGEDGAVTMFGTARLKGEDWGFDGSVGAIGADHESELSAIFTGENAQEGAMLRVNGELRDDGGFAGEIASSAPDLSRVVTAPPLTFGAEAKVTAAGSVLSGSDLTLELGGVGGHGSFRWQAGNPGFRLRLATTMFDLDQWTKVWSQPSASGFSSRFDVTADAAQLAGGMLRDLHLDLEQGRNLVLHDFSATLPGEAAFTARGSASFIGQVLQIDRGAVTLKAGDLMPSLAWLVSLDPDLPRVATAAAPLAADLAANVSGTAGAIKLAGLKGTIGGIAVQGTVGLTRGDRTRVEADLTLDRLPVGSFTTLGLPPKLDYDLTIAAKSAVFDGTEVRDAGFHLVRDQTGMRLENAKASFAGAAVTGSFDILPNGTVSAAAFDAQAPNLAPLLALLPKDGWQGTSALAALPATLKATFAGPQRALAGNITVDAGETELVAQPVIDLPDQTVSGAMTLRNPGAWRMVQLFGGPDVSPWVGVGSLAMLARFDAKAGHVGLDYIDLGFGGMRVAGGLMFDLSGGKWAVNGQLESDRLPIAWPALTADGQFPTGWVAGGSGKIALTAKSLTYNDGPVASDFHANLGLADGVLTLDGVGMNWGSGSISGSANWRPLDPVPSVNATGKFDQIALAGPVTGGALDLDRGTLAGNMALSASGHTPNTLLATLAGNVDFSASNGEITGFDLAKAQLAARLPGIHRPQNALAAALKGGNTAFSQLVIAAAVKDGGVSIDNGALLVPDPGSHPNAAPSKAEISGGVDLPNGVVDLALTLHPPDNAPPVVARYKGKFAAPTTTTDMTAFRKWLVQRWRTKSSTKAKKG